MKKKKYMLNIILILLVSTLTLFYLVHSKMLSNLSALKELTPLNLLFIFTVVILYILFDSLIIFFSIKRVHQKASLKDGIGAYLMGNLGSNITPSKSGHLPFCLFYYKKKNYTIEESFTIIIQNHLTYSTCLFLLYLLSAVVSKWNHYTLLLGNFTIDLFYIGLLGSFSNLCYILLLFLITHNSFLEKSLITIEGKILLKFKKIDHLEAFEAEKKIKIKIYKECLNNYFKKPYQYFLSMFIYSLFMIFCYGLPYIIYLCLSKEHFSLYHYCLFFSLMQTSNYVSTIVPIPGGTAIAEFSFLSVYRAVMGDLCTSAMLIWRSVTYFLLIIIDFIYFIFFVQSNKKNENMAPIMNSNYNKTAS